MAGGRCEKGIAQTATARDPLAFVIYAKERICALVQSLLLSTPCRRTELGDCLEEPHSKEELPMRSITAVIFPMILAAGLSGLMFTATLS